MSDIVSPLFQWLNANPNLAGLVTFIISAGESVAIIGTIVPGSIMMTALGALAGAGIIPLWGTIFWAILGAIVGDSISYWIGRYFKERLPFVWPFRNYPGLLINGEVFFFKYGGMSVFIGRFVGPVRALVPLVAGMLGMKPVKFTIANVTSAIGWAPAYMFPGIVLGAASLELPPDIAIHVILTLLLIFLFVLLCLWFLYKLLQLAHNQTNEFQNWIWIKLKQSKHFSKTTFLLKHYDSHQSHGQLNLLLYFLIITVLFFSLSFYVCIVGPSNIMFNDAVYHLFRGLSFRTDSLNTLMINITLLGQKTVLMPLVFMLFLGLMIWHRRRTACHILALGILITLSIFISKYLFHTPRPTGIFFVPPTYSMPSGHAALSATIFMGLAFFLACDVRHTYRWIVYTIALALIFLIGLSRLYLGVHWATDVISAWFLSGMILLLIIISYRRQREKPTNPYVLLVLTIITLAFSFSIYHYKHFHQLKVDYTAVDAPINSVGLDDWWNGKAILPAYRVSLFGLHTQQINIEWASKLSVIRQNLLKEGWSEPPERNMIATFHRIADISSTRYLPLVSPQYLDKQPQLILTREINPNKDLLVIQLWNANRLIKELNTNLWVGVVSLVPRTYSWIIKKNAGDILIDLNAVFANQTTLKYWQTKIIVMPKGLIQDKNLNQKIILIQPHSKP